MLQRILILVMLAILTGSTSNAQSKISGTVVDKNDKSLANANVLLLKSTDSSMVKGMVSSAPGEYIFENIKPGNYLITVTFTGMSQVYSPAFAITENNTATNLGKLKMMEATDQLNHVTVTAKRQIFEQKIDRLVVNVANSVTAAGNTALEVLERSPGVIVDRQNNTISMNRKDGVVLMINGKISYMPIAAAVQMLSAMSSGNIEKIELITTPPANLDAAGNAGYINIVLKQNENFGTNGSYTATAGYGQGAITAAGFTINHRSKKVNIYGDLSFAQAKTTPFMFFDNTITNNGVITQLSGNTDRNAKHTNFDGRLGMDFQVDKKTVIGGLVSFYTNRYSVTSLNQNYIVKQYHLDTSISIANNEINDWRNYSANVNLQHNFSESEKLAVNIDYIYFSNDEPVEYFNRYSNGQGIFLYEEDTRSGKKTPINLVVGSIDYSKNIGKKLSMEAGIKGTNSGFNNDISYERFQLNSWVKDMSASATYKLKEKYGAAYTSFNLTVNEKTSLKAGLRYEYTTSNLGTTEIKNIVDRRYGNLFPTFFASHKINDDNAFNFSYSRRITRPTFNDLAPFTYYSSPNSLITGNPALQPAIANTVKADYVIKNYLFSISYSKEDNSISGFQPQTDSITNKTLLKAENLVNQKTVSFILSVPVNVGAWWSMQYNIIVVGQQVNALYKKLPIRLQQGNMNINMTQKFKLPKDYAIELSGFYQSRSLAGLYVTKAFGTLDLGIRKNMPNNKGSFVLNGGNLLNTMIFRLNNNLPAQNLVGNTSLQFDSRVVKLTYTRNFGNAVLKGNRQRSTGAEDEKNRVQAQ
jgi:outer membrane receptor protein involved in Fe transport